MRQRVMIAMALSCSPKLLIADEPTTALDVTTQAQIVELLHTLQREEDMAMIFVTHDLGVIADVADDVVVMYAGQIVEHAAAADLFAPPAAPLHRGPPPFDPPAHAERRATARHPGHGAASGPVPGRLPFRAALLLRAGRLHGAPVPIRARGGGRCGDGQATPSHLARCVRQDELVLSGPPAESGRQPRRAPTGGTATLDAGRNARCSR